MNILKSLLKKNIVAKAGDHSVTAILSRVPLFEDLSRRELHSIERIMHQRDYQRGELIFRKGDRGLGMYIILNGTVSVLSEKEDHELSELSDGDFFGEVALLDESFRSATVRAKTDCRILGFFQPDLNALIASDPRLGIKIVMKLGRYACLRLRNSNDRVIAISAELEQLKNSSQALKADA